MSGSPGKQERLETGFVPGETWLAAMEARWLIPGRAFEFDPDQLAFPHPFSHAKPGSYQFMALLDTDHSYAYTGQNAGDLCGPVVAVPALDPMHAAPVALALDRRTGATLLPKAATVKLAEFRSPLLSAFWGRPIVMRAGVILPPEALTYSARN